MSRTQTLITGRERYGCERVWAFMKLAMENHLASKPYELDGYEWISRKCAACHRYYVRTAAHKGKGCPSCEKQ